VSSDLYVSEGRYWKDKMATSVKNQEIGDLTVAQFKELIQETFFS